MLQVKPQQDNLYWCGEKKTAGKMNHLQTKSVKNVILNKSQKSNL